jgi:DNA-binding NtrC family response regulator
MSALRQDVTQLGAPSVTAAFHLTVGEVGAKRGFVTHGARHLRTAQRILAGNPNAWLESWTQNDLMGLCLLRGEFKTALLHGEQAIAYGQRTGSRFSLGLVLNNIGNAFFGMGDFENAAIYFNRAADALPANGQAAGAVRTGLSRIYLRNGDLSGCRRLLSSIAMTSDAGEAAGLYVHRHAHLVYIHLLIEEGQRDKAIEMADRGIQLARKSADEYVISKLTLVRARLLAERGDWQSAAASVDLVGSTIGSHPIELYASYEETLGSASAEENVHSSLVHLARAERTFDSLGNAAGQTGAKVDSRNGTRARPAAGPESISESLQAVAALFMFAGHPELVCHEVAQILRASGRMDAAYAIRRAADRGAERSDYFGDCQADATSFQTIAVSDSIDLFVRPNQDIESHATLNAIRLLLSTVRDLERARTEREERLTLWPVEELPVEDENAVVLGKMRNLMILARKVARINVAVLITGESGTGKEVLARAIHRASPRAAKPFVPINCTAVPRELLESQLFGHRRGAFTGADRDSLGMIRTARDGTLFLDEIGELGLDLQPKLLRFLESGEIAPLGEPSPQQVDVRIIAATNANLEALVEAGRFREDLFYRLNVIRVSIPPLRERRDEIPALVHHLVAKVAAEFGKGRLRVAEDAMEHLILYGWPGNVRELQNELRRIIALAEPDSVLNAEVLSPHILGATRAARRTNGSEIAVPLYQKLTDTIAHIEREMIRAALGAHEGRLEAAARALGISRKGLYLKRQRLGL